MGGYNNNSRFDGPRGGGRPSGRGGSSFGGARGGSRGGFGGRDGGSRDFRSRDGGSRQMHDAVCAECGNTCQVPFMPMSGKPVYCSDCFEKRGNGEENVRPPRANYNKPSFSEKRPFSAPARSSQYGAEGDNAKFEQINVKLDKILKTLAYLSKEKSPKPSTKPEVISETVADTVVAVEEVAAEIVDVAEAAPVKAKVRKPRAKKTVTATE